MQDQLCCVQHVDSSLQLCEQLLQDEQKMILCIMCILYVIDSALILA